MHKIPNLYRNRLSTYYLRIKINGREVKRSLGTKEPALAKKAALAFALAKVGGTIAVVDRAAGGGHLRAPALLTPLSAVGQAGHRLHPEQHHHCDPVAAS